MQIVDSHATPMPIQHLDGSATLDGGLPAACIATHLRSISPACVDPSSPKTCRPPPGAAPAGGHQRDSSNRSRVGSTGCSFQFGRTSILLPPEQPLKHPKSMRTKCVNSMEFINKVYEKDSEFCDSVKKNWSVQVGEPYYCTDYNLRMGLGSR